MTSAALHAAQQQHEQKAAEEARVQEEAAQRSALLREFPSLQPAAKPPQRTCSSQQRLINLPKFKQLPCFLSDMLALDVVCKVGRSPSLYLQVLGVRLWRM